MENILWSITVELKKAPIVSAYPCHVPEDRHGKHCNLQTLSPKAYCGLVGNKGI